MRVSYRLTENMWQAIVNNDASSDGAFVYAIKTTRIFCKPSCKSRVPNKENVLIFRDAEDALTAGFRPCKRCKPLNERLPDVEWADQIAKYIEQHYNEQLNLQTIAEHCHGSPYHLHRTFKRIKGMTPAEYIQRLKIRKASESLVSTDKTMENIAQEVGMTNPAYFITWFKKMTGLTPGNYRQAYRYRSRREGASQ